CARAERVLRHLCRVSAQVHMTISLCFLYAEGRGGIKEIPLRHLFLIGGPFQTPLPLQTNNLPTNRDHESRQYAPVRDSISLLSRPPCIAPVYRRGPGVPSRITVDRARDTLAEAHCSNHRGPKRTALWTLPVGPVLRRTRIAAILPCPESWPILRWLVIGIALRQAELVQIFSQSELSVGQPTGSAHLNRKSYRACWDA